MKTVFFISRRLSARSGLATLSVATSIVVMLLGLMISNGFRHEIQDSVFSSWGNMAVMSPYMDLMSEKHFVKAGQGQLDCIRASSKGIEDVSAVIYRAGVLKSQEGVSGEVRRHLFRISASWALSTAAPEWRMTRSPALFYWFSSTCILVGMMRRVVRSKLTIRLMLFCRFCVLLLLRAR